MSQYKSSFLSQMEQRGFIHQCTDASALDQQLQSGPVSAYIGFDCTAPSLHIGSLVQIMMLRWFQKTGHKPIILLGGGTTRIGDPSGKDQSRKMMTEKTINANMNSIKNCFEAFLTFGDGPTDAVFVNNADWLDGLGYIDFLRDIGPHFTLNRMLTFDSVKTRLDREQPLTFLEFNYMILQAFDFVQLAKTQKCILQMGGSDQWGNIINGIDLGRRLKSPPLFGLTTNLITTSDGKKMGKTAGGAIWLNEQQLPAYDYWQFWRGCDDADTGRFLRLFTDIDLAEIEQLEELKGAELNSAKIRLADAATSLARGQQAAIRSRETARKTFSGGSGDSLPSLMVNEVRANQGIGILDAYYELELMESKSAVRRLIKQGGAKLNGATITDENHVIMKADFVDGRVKLSAGKKKHGLVILP